MTLREFLEKFDSSNPNWSQVPAGWPHCDLGGLSSQEIGQFNSIKTSWELSRPKKPQQRTRAWKDPKGYQYLGVWQNAALLRVLTRVLTKGMIKGEIKGGDKRRVESEDGRWERRRKAQMDDAARSVKRNIEEGYKRATTSEYIDFIGYSQGSLEEVKGDIRDCLQDGMLTSKPDSSLRDLGIDLRVAKGTSKGTSKGEPTEAGHPYSQPLKTLNPEALTYEMFTELINKTDYLLRKLVESLEKKMYTERKGYQVEQARIRDKFRKK